MEGGKMRALVVVVLVMGMLVGQSSAGFKGCYAKCFMFCMIKPPHSVMLCGGKCLKHCIIPAPTAQPTIQPTGHDFCKLGCASTSCTNISTQADPVEEKVESCVGSCSELCIKNYLSP